MSNLPSAQSNSLNLSGSKVHNTLQELADSLGGKAAMALDKEGAGTPGISTEESVANKYLFNVGQDVPGRLVNLNI